MGRRGNQSFEKRRKEKARLERQAAKRERRQGGGDLYEDVDETAENGPDETELMERFRVLSERHAVGLVGDAAYAAERRHIFLALGLEP